MQDKTNKTPLVTGEIILEYDDGLLKSLRSSPNVSIIVRLGDVTFADTESKVIVQHLIKGAEFIIDCKAKKSIIIPFELYGKIANRQASYAISVHVDMDGDGKIGLGDYINTESYPVLTHGYPNHVTVKMKLID